MPLWIISFVKDNWKALTIAAVVIAAVMYVQGLRLEIAMQETKIVQLQHDIETLEQNNKTLEAAIKTQNNAIDKIDALAAATNKHFAKLGVSVGAQSAELSNQLANILKDKKPKTCEETMTYLLDARKGYAK